MVRRPHGLGEHQRAVGVLDGRRQAAEQLVLATRLRHDVASLGERLEVLAGGAAVGPGVAFGEMRDRGEEVAEGLERHPVHGAEVLTGAHESLLAGGVLGPFVDRQLHPDERHARWCAHPVGDGLLEAVAVTDAAEVREQQLGHRVVAAFQGGGEAEPFVVLAEHGAAQGLAAEPVTLVGDQQSTARAGWQRLVGGRRVAGRDEHVARRGVVPAAVAQPPDPGSRERCGEATVPLLHEHTRRHDDEHEPISPQRVGRGGDGDVGLARAGDRLDHAAAAAPQPADQGIELPTVELVLLRAEPGEHGSARRSGGHGHTKLPAPPGGGFVDAVGRLIARLGDRAPR